MPVSLIKGERVSLDKGLKVVKVGLSWDIRTGLTADLDASILLLGKNDKMLNDSAIVFYNKLESDDGAISHSGDNREGGSENDDEVISVNLDKTVAESLLICITSYASPNQDAVIFGRVKNAKVRLYDAENNNVLYEFDLTEDMSNSTSMEMAKLYRHNGSWKFSAIGERVGTAKNGLEDVYNKYL